jgi:hypothetical protein
MSSQLTIFKQEKQDEHWVRTYISENYIVSNYGTVVQIDTQKIIPLVLSKNRNHQKYIIKLKVNGLEVSQTISQIIYHSFNKSSPIKGYSVYHINGNPLDNKLTNLQFITNRDIAAKRIGGSQYGTGVQFDKGCTIKPFKVMIGINGKNTYLGNFETAEQARTAYQNKKQQIQKQNENSIKT